MNFPLKKKSKHPVLLWATKSPTSKKVKGQIKGGIAPSLALVIIKERNIEVDYQAKEPSEMQHNNELPGAPNDSKQPFSSIFPMQVTCAYENAILSGSAQKAYCKIIARKDLVDWGAQ